MPPKQAATPSSRVPKGFHSETPLSRIHGLIAQLTDDLKDLSEDAPARSTLSELTSLVTGFEPYMASVSSKPPQVVRDSIEESNNVDWAAVHKAGRASAHILCSSSKKQKQTRNTSSSRRCQPVPTKLSYFNNWPACPARSGSSKLAASTARPLSLLPSSRL